MEAGDRGHGHGNGKAIAEAGRQEVERGLDRLEGKHTKTSTASVTSTGPDPNAPQAPTATAAPRVDTSGEEAREKGTADTHGYPADKGTTASAAGSNVRGGGSDQYRDEQSASRATPHVRPAAAADVPSGQLGADVEPRMASGGPEEQPRDAPNAPRSGNIAAGQPEEQRPSGVEAQTEERRGSRPTDVDSG